MSEFSSEEIDDEVVTFEESEILPKTVEDGLQDDGEEVEG